jgi:DsbC/DsbD-like thiol-disulfide interchange protein
MGLVVLIVIVRVIAWPDPRAGCRKPSDLRRNHPALSRVAYKAMYARVLVSVLALIISCTGAAASPPPGQGPPQPVTWSLAVEPTSVVPGGTVTAVVTATIEDGWHVYAAGDAGEGPRPLRIAVPPGPVFAAAGALEAPEPERDMDPNFGHETAFYAHHAVLRLPIRAAADAQAGTRALALDVTFQACNHSICLPARGVTLTADVAVTAKQ